MGCATSFFVQTERIAKFIRNHCAHAQLLRQGYLPPWKYARHLMAREVQRRTPKGAAMTISRIVVATDFSEIADHALDYALTFAAMTGANVTIVHAYDVLVYGRPGGMLLPSPEVEAQISRAAREALDATVKRACERCPTANGELREGDARDQVTKVAENLGADLIVVGTHGRRGMKRMLLGSVAESLVRTSSIPVLTVPQAPE
jgi:nucleotide-binding universal stress UspA family protein